MSEVKVLIEKKGFHVTTDNMTTVCERRPSTMPLLSTLVGQVSGTHYNFINTAQWINMYIFTAHVVSRFSYVLKMLDFYLEFNSSPSNCLWIWWHYLFYYYWDHFVISISIAKSVDFLTKTDLEVLAEGLNELKLMW